LHLVGILFPHILNMSKLLNVIVTKNSHICLLSTISFKTKTTQCTIKCYAIYNKPYPWTQWNALVLNFQNIKYWISTSIFLYFYKPFFSWPIVNVCCILFSLVISIISQYFQLIFYINFLNLIFSERTRIAVLKRDYTN